MRDAMLAWALLPACLTRPPIHAEPLSHVGVFVAKYTAAPTPFSTRAAHAGDAVFVHISCGNTSTTEPEIDLRGPPQWRFTALASGGTSGYWAASFGAIAPDTDIAMFTPVAQGGCGVSSNLFSGITVLGDEFANNDPAGSTSTFDAPLVTSGVGRCETELRATFADEAVWAACTYGGALTGGGAGYDSAGDDGSGDLSEYKLTVDPAGTNEHVMFDAPFAGNYVVTAVGIKGM
jgi:hypothetical protein